MKKLLIGIVVGAALVFVLEINKDNRAAPAVSPSQTSNPTSSLGDYRGPSRSPNLSHRSFAGYDCTVDCSGHEAGYRWAEEHDIDDEDDCDNAAEHSNSASFGEGCKAYVNGDSPTEDVDTPDEPVDEN